MVVVLRKGGECKMAKIKQKCVLCRREGKKLFLKGSRCYSPKCPIERKGALPPGQHGQKRMSRLSDFGVRLREKQKARRTFGVSERVMNNYYKKAARYKGETGKRLLQLLEIRLDNVIFKAGLVNSRSEAKQLISHGFCLVNNKRVDINSFSVKKGELISLNTKGLKLDYVKKALAQKLPCPAWLSRKAAVVRMERLPERKEMESDIDEQLITEYYSK